MTDEQILKAVNAVLAGDKSSLEALPAVKVGLEERIRQHAQTASGYRPKVAACINKIAKGKARNMYIEPGYSPFGDQYCFFNNKVFFGMNGDYHYPVTTSPISEETIRDNFYCYAADRDTDEHLTLDLGELRAQAKIFKAGHGKELNLLEFGECEALFEVDLVLLLCDTLRVSTVKICLSQYHNYAVYMFAENEAHEWGLVPGRKAPGGE